MGYQPRVNDPQKIGSALTYARRYSLCAILSVAADEDNDGNVAGQKNTETKGRLQLKGSSNGTAKTVVHPQDLRVKQIRTLLNYPVDLVKEWLSFQNVERPSQLEVNIVDDLVKTMCLAWASNKIDHPNHAQNSYAKHVVDAVAKGADEVVTIQDWMQHVQSPHQAQVKA
ncbi:MAG: ERF family protein [Nostoc sp.]|uniref:ERF family protein n=1 Tax=Nostoc sp. TaxID=1180 RepID=UPI002FF725B4